MGQAEVLLHPGHGVLGIELRMYDLRLDFSAELRASTFAVTSTLIRGDPT